MPSMLSDVVVGVRLDVPKGVDAREVAQRMGVQVQRVRDRDDVVQVYGSKIVNVAKQPTAASYGNATAEGTMGMPGPG